MRIGFGTMAVLAASAAMVTACGMETTAADQPGIALGGVIQIEGYTGQLGASFSGSLQSGSNADVRWLGRQAAGPVVVPPGVIVAPASVQRGVPFQVTVNTIGLNGCWSGVGQEVRITGRVVELTPFDAHSGAELCTEVLLVLPHRSTITLDGAGEWTIRVSGRRVQWGTQQWEPIGAEKTIVVQ